METVCHNQLFFESLLGKEVVADFQGGRITSDAGGLLLRELGRRYQVSDKGADCLQDSRDSRKEKHKLLSLVRQRLFSPSPWATRMPTTATLAQAGLQDHGRQGSGDF